jgi:hypothetical protein
MPALVFLFNSHFLTGFNFLNWRFLICPDDADDIADSGISVFSMIEFTMARALHVEVSADSLAIDLVDCRTIAVPVDLFPGCSTEAKWLV